MRSGVDYFYDKSSIYHSSTSISAYQHKQIGIDQWELIKSDPITILKSTLRNILE